MDDLVRWLGEQLDEDERIARAAVSEHEREPRLVECTAGGQWSRRYGDYGGTEVVDGAGHPVVSVAHDKGAAVRTHIAAHDPARVLREIDAKRRILRALQSAEVALRNTEPGKELNELMTGSANSLRAAVRMLATAYADRPGYREEWRP